MLNLLSGRLQVEELCHFEDTPEKAKPTAKRTQTRRHRISAGARCAESSPSSQTAVLSKTGTAATRARCVPAAGRDRRHRDPKSCGAPGTDRGAELRGRPGGLGAENRHAAANSRDTARPAQLELAAGGTGTSPWAGVPPGPRRPLSRLPNPAYVGAAGEMRPRLLLSAPKCICMHLPGQRRSEGKPEPNAEPPEPQVLSMNPRRPRALRRAPRKPEGGPRTARGGGAAGGRGGAGGGAARPGAVRGAGGAPRGAPGGGAAPLRTARCWVSALSVAITSANAAPGRDGPDPDPGSATRGSGSGAAPQQREGAGSGAAAPGAGRARTGGAARRGAAAGCVIPRTWGDEMGLSVLKGFASQVQAVVSRKAPCGKRLKSRCNSVALQCQKKRDTLCRLFLKGQRSFLNLNRQFSSPVPATGCYRFLP